MTLWLQPLHLHISPPFTLTHLVWLAGNGTTTCCAVLLAIVERDVTGFVLSLARMLGDSVIPLPHIYGARIKGVEVFCPLDPPPPYEAVAAGAAPQVCTKTHFTVAKE